MKATHRDMSIDDYHAHPAIGKSMLSDFDSHPKLFDCRYVAKDGMPFKSTPSTDFGSMVDAWLLERERCVEIPSDVLSKSGSKAGNAWKAFRDEHAGDILMKSADVRICERIEANIRQHYDAGNLLMGKGDSQKSLFWRDTTTGLECKCRFDFVPTDVLVDVKTARSTNPRDFASQCWLLKYFWQAAHYRRGWYEYTGDWRDFVFAVIKNSEPYDVATYVIADEWLAIGEHQVEETLRKIAACAENGTWLPPNYGRRVELRQPRFTEFGNDYQTGENE